MGIKVFILCFALLPLRLMSQIQVIGENERYYVSFETGLCFTSYFNNEYSRELTSILTNNVDLTFSRIFGNSFNHSLGIHAAGFTHYQESSKKKFIELLDNNNDLEFGPIIFNDWGEWRIGLDYTYVHELKKRYYLSSSIITDIVFGDRSNTIYTRDNNEFIYAYVPKTKIGLSINGEVGCSWNFKRGFRSSIGVYYDFIYGYYPSQFEVREGSGNDPLDNYVANPFFDNFTISRHRFKIGLNLVISDLK